ncbi:unnamed protein product [Parascedosporium putredinis]|uniref:Uncharacterized protein n=1 Tax=Parascedosporium putredinis TaxID=1442378 RepID=A0A9P1M9Q4_9PEZI|nr:unnamed protein product [Parascedosporium putredinis]CAI7992492.1 unnamed protein product [Parascedosporium putredinis]
MGNSSSKPNKPASAPPARPHPNPAAAAPVGPDVVKEKDMPQVRALYEKVHKAAIDGLRRKEPTLRHWPDSAIPVDRGPELREEIDEVLSKMSSELQSLCSQGVCRSPQTLKAAIHSEADHVQGNDALAVYVVDKVRQPLRSDYGSKLLHLTAGAMRPHAPPGPSNQKLKGDEAAADILKNQQKYVSAVLAAYDKAVKDTGFKTDTQLGARADHVSYR